MEGDMKELMLATLSSNKKRGTWQCPTFAWINPHYHRR